MSHVHIRRLTRILREFEAARVSLDVTLRLWPNQVPMDISGARGLELKHLREALDRLEGTYVIRLFAEFEGVLRDHLTTAKVPVPRTAEKLIDRVTSRHSIPVTLRDKAHDVRRFRNSLVHDVGNEAAAPVAFDQALSALNRFLATLP